MLHSKFMCMSIFLFTVTTESIETLPGSCLKPGSDIYDYLSELYTVGGFPANVTGSTF